MSKTTKMEGFTLCCLELFFLREGVLLDPWVRKGQSSQKKKNQVMSFRFGIEVVVVVVVLKKLFYKKYI